MWRLIKENDTHQIQDAGFSPVEKHDLLLGASG